MTQIVLAGHWGGRRMVHLKEIAKRFGQRILNYIQTYFKIKIYRDFDFFLPVWGKKKMGKFRNRDNGQFGNSFLKTHPWGSERSKFKYFIVVIIILIILIILIIITTTIIIIIIVIVVDVIMLNLEIVEAVLINIVELFSDPEDL